MNAAGTFAGKFQQEVKKEDASLIELLATITIGIFGMILSESGIQTGNPISFILGIIIQFSAASWITMKFLTFVRDFIWDFVDRSKRKDTPDVFGMPDYSILRPIQISQNVVCFQLLRGPSIVRLPLTKPRPCRAFKTRPYRGSIQICKQKQASPDTKTSLPPAWFWCKMHQPVKRGFDAHGSARQHKQTARLSVSFEKIDYERVTAIAEANDVSTAWIIRKAVCVYLDAYEHSATSISIHDEQQHEVAPTVGEKQS